MLSPRRTTRNRWEEALMSMPGAPAYHFVTDEQLDKMFLSLGCKPSELAARRADYDKRMDSMLDLTGGKIPFIGAKPVAGERIHIFTITNDHLAIRLWDGGLQDDGQFLLDLVDSRTKKPVNSPAGYKIYVLPRVGRMLGIPGPLMSWEVATNIPRKDIKDGEERFSVLEGSPCMLRRPGKDDFFFAVPDRARDPLPGMQLATPIMSWQQ
ncbi:hypothetical protein HETIRDRAFT_108286 [Heterobasidion irregulare TC 32-1]|uniref:Uncharacterized protein n=1 Tax=Heterobasidion irregulare (strain TC 32-1) TaxID=747525 RepID=W4JPQ2_HETIT|nr:uncharacterized protein HETIRDRAFT_108286 [Heterobasidion irregulare TC 32-1]ETW75065.1 hypothetical protein HETIRDRAFT_108286 [Heterobasidion irregulare TC 32-1]